MPQRSKIRRALISVYDKTGIVEFARALHEEFGIEIVSTGGTAKTLTDAGIPVMLVKDITGFPELLGGRVKTLHPKIFAAILADRDHPEHVRQLAEQGIEPIDMVVVNLYPFEQTVADPDCKFEDAIEMIDIGGVCLLRAAAKNHKHVLVAGDPEYYAHTLEVLRGKTYVPDNEPDERLLRASYGFTETSVYDAVIGGWLGKQERISDFPWLKALFGRNWGKIRYGENPHQQAELIQYLDWTAGPDLTISDSGVCSEAQEQPRMSVNNYVDASAALELCAELSRAEIGLHRLLACATRSEGGGVEAQHPPAVGPRPTVWHRLLAGATTARHADPESANLKGKTPGLDKTVSHACCFIKHTNACGAAVALPEGDSPEAAAAAALQAYRQAYLGDPNAAMGGILAVNFAVDEPFAEAVMETYQQFGKPLKEAGHPNPPQAFFVEVWVAPSFDEAAVKLIRAKKKWGERVRLLAVGEMTTPLQPEELEYKSIAGGMLAQTRDLVGLNEDEWKVVTERQPTEQELADVRLAWLICKYTKSNAISICAGGMLIGNGAGQMSRVMSCQIATWLARDNGHEEKLRGAVAASDGFFPFRDGPDVLADAGVTAIVQPGGSKRDQAVIDACNERGLAMIHTGTRHFRH